MQLPGLYLQPSGTKGKGVFTTGPITADCLVELAPVIVMTLEDRRLLDQTLLHDYIFEWQDGAACCMALGWVSMYNHSYSANLEYFMDYEEALIGLRSVRDIAAGEELCINYNGDWNDPAPVWFDVDQSTTP